MYKNVSPALKNALRYNKISVYEQKSLLAYKSASFSHRNVCPHSQMPLQPQICLSLFKNPLISAQKYLAPNKNSIQSIKMCVNTKTCFFTPQVPCCIQKILSSQKNVCPHSKMPLHPQICLSLAKTPNPSIKMPFSQMKIPSSQ